MVIYKFLLHFVRCIVSTGHGSLKLPENTWEITFKIVKDYLKIVLDVELAGEKKILSLMCTYFKLS